MYDPLFVQSEKKVFVMKTHTLLLIHNTVIREGEN